MARSFLIICLVSLIHWSSYADVEIHKTRVEFELVTVIKGASYLDIHAQHITNKLQNAVGVEYDVFVGSGTFEVFLKKVKTDEHGKVRLKLGGFFDNVDRKDSVFRFVCKQIQKDKIFERHVSRDFKKACWSVMTTINSKEFQMRGEFTDKVNDSCTTPIPGALVQFFLVEDGVRKPITKWVSRTTTYSGSFFKIFDKTVKGDEQGRIRLIVQAKKAEYGTYEYVIREPWGLTPDQWKLRKKLGWVFVISTSLLVFYITFQLLRKRAYRLANKRR